MPHAERRWPVAALIAGSVALISTVLLLTGNDAGAHLGHPQKELFFGRWYNAATMELTTSQLNNPNTLVCDSNFSLCSPKWAGAVTNAVNDWNNQQDTANFVEQGNYNILYDVNIFAIDEIIQPGILGIALHYDVNEVNCDPDACTYRYGEAYVADDSHTGLYGTAVSKQATVVHELGHLLSLCHESVQGNCHTSEGVIFECGTDDSGSVPFSIMSYDCIDPPGVGGSGMYLVQPWDVCGVNHAYPDGAFGFAGCPATPTPTAPPTLPPTPSPTPIAAGPGAWGNVDCGGGISSVDALKLLRFGAGLSVSQTEPCTNIGDPHPVVLTHDQGDTDCSNTVNSVDALKILRFTAGLSVAQTQPCPIIGTDP